jgi:hypothetical protein
MILPPPVTTQRRHTGQLVLNSTVSVTRINQRLTDSGKVTVERKQNILGHIAMQGLANTFPIIA